MNEDLAKKIEAQKIKQQLEIDKKKAEFLEQTQQQEILRRQNLELFSELKEKYDGERIDNGLIDVSFSQNQTHLGLWNLKGRFNLSVYAENGNCYIINSGMRIQCNKDELLDKINDQLVTWI